MPFQELPHTADWSLRVWAPSLPLLFSESVRGMYSLSGARAASDPLVMRLLELGAADVETLLVAFLSELLNFSEQERLCFEDIQVELQQTNSEWKLKSQMAGAALVSLTRAIKAVTFHNLHIERTPKRYQVEIVFDV